MDGGAESLLQDTEVIQRLPGPGSCYLPRLKRQPQQVVLPESMGQARIRSLSSVSGATEEAFPLSEMPQEAGGKKTKGRLLIIPYMNTNTLPFSLLSPMCLSHGSQLTQNCGKATQGGKDGEYWKGRTEMLVQGRGVTIALISFFYNSHTFKFSYCHIMVTKE